MQRGEIRWYKFKPPDKERPVLILTRNSIMAYLGAITIAPVTTNIREIPSEVFLDQNDGMPRECAINFDHIQTVQKDKIGRLISRLSEDRFVEIKHAIHFALEL